MPSIILKLFLLFITFFTLQGYAQTKRDSKHPLLDKYYPRAEKDTSANVTAAPKPTPQFVQPPVIAPVPPSTPAPAPIVTTTVNESINSAPLPNQKISTGTIIHDTLAMTKTIPEVVPKPETKIVAETIPSSSVTSVASSNTTVSTPLLVPVQTVVPPRAVSSAPYIDTRLGSSTQAYDTWKKNNNGAGSVTTSVK